MRLLTLRLAPALLGSAVVLGACFAGSSTANPGYEPYPGTYDNGYNNGVSSYQVQACTNLVSSQYNVSSNYVGTRSDGVDGNGNAVVRWTLQNGPSGTCLVNSQNRVVRFESNDTGYGYNNNGGYHNGQPYPSNGYPANQPQGVLGQPTGESANHFQVDACKMEIVRRFNINSDAIQTDQGVKYTDGNAVVGWSTARGDRGTCVVNQSNQVMRLDRS